MPRPLVVEVDYVTTVEDGVRLAEYLWWQPLPVRANYHFYLWAPVAVLCGAAVRGTPFIGWPATILLLSLAAGYAACYPLVRRTLRRRRTRAASELLAEKGVIGHITLELTKDTLTERTAAGVSVARWKEMIGVEVVGDCTYIFVSPTETAVIPQHGFDREEDYAAVRDFAQSKLRSVY